MVKDEFVFMDFRLLAVKTFNRRVLTCMKCGMRGNMGNDYRGAAKCRMCGGAHETKECPKKKPTAPVSHKRVAPSVTADHRGSTKHLRLDNIFVILGGAYDNAL